MNTITLRDVALRLARLPGSRSSKIADGELLGLLKSGELKAGFFFSGGSSLWIPIPTHYWANVSSHAFRSIGRSDDDEHQLGTYTVRITKFADEYVSALMQQQRHQGDDTAGQTNGLLLTELKLALSHASRCFEALIPETEWSRYLELHNIEEQHLATKSKSGRHQREGWRDVAVIIGAYIIKHLETAPNLTIKNELAADKIHAIAVNDQVRGLPSKSTIKDLLGRIRSKAESISID